MGARAFREAIAREFTRRYGLRVDADEQVTVCCGATEAMMATMIAIVDPGEEVVIFEPFTKTTGPTRFSLAQRPATSRCATRLAVRSRRARCGIQQPDQGHHPQHTEQSDREGLRAGGTRDDRDALP